MLWKNAYGMENAEKIAYEMLRVAPTYIRINSLAVSPDEFCDALDNSGILYEKHELLPCCIKLAVGSDLKKLDKIKENWYYHQDVASQLACFLLDAKPGEHVADVCAAPGGKSFTVAQYMHGEGKILSCDVHDFKVEKLAARAKMLGINNIHTMCRDASVTDTSVTDTSLEDKFDKVVCDVPCSGLGAIRRRPEIKYKDLTSFDSLPNTQLAILEASAKLVKKGGILQYSTCTLNPAENERIVAGFLQNNPHFVPHEMKLENGGFSLDSHEFTMFPWIFDSDGFYVAQLMRSC